MIFMGLKGRQGSILLRDPFLMERKKLNKKFPMNPKLKTHLNIQEPWKLERKLGTTFRRSFLP